MKKRMLLSLCTAVLSALLLLAAFPAAALAAETIVLTAGEPYITAIAGETVDLTRYAVTLNGAAAIDMADKVGTVEAGKLGDLVIWDAPDLDYICYRFGSNLAKKVIKRGRVM